MWGNHDVMQDRECIAFEWTRDTDQRIHKLCVCWCVPCSSRLQPIVGWIIFILYDICRICPLEICCKGSLYTRFPCHWPMAMPCCWVPVWAKPLPMAARHCDMAVRMHEVMARPWVGVCVPLALIYWWFVIHLPHACRGGTAVQFPANSSLMCCVELALDRLLFSSKGFLRRGFYPFFNPMAVPRWWAPIRAKKLSVAATAPEIFACWHLAIAITSN